MTFTAIVLEFLQVIRHFIAFNGIKMKRGLGFKLKIVFSILPILSIILYIFEAIIVFGYSGERCFCQYKKLYVDTGILKDICYHCLDEVGMKFIIASFIKLFYIFSVLILLTI
jgi:hypothetical protein